MPDRIENIEKLERDLWEAADNLRANSKLTSSDYFMPVLGVIFLRHAANRFDAAHRQIEQSAALISARIAPGHARLDTKGRNTS
jgi:type I restriction enzyme M protein